MPVTLPSAYGGLSRGLSQGFGMMNLIDRTKMQKEEVAQQAQYRNEMLVLKQQEGKFQQQHTKWIETYTELNDKINRGMKIINPNQRTEYFNQLSTLYPENKYPKMNATIKALSVAEKDVADRFNKGMKEIGPMLQRKSLNGQEMILKGVEYADTPLGPLLTAMGTARMKSEYDLEKTKTIVQGGITKALIKQQDTTNKQMLKGLKDEQSITLGELNAIYKRNGIGTVDIMSLMALPSGKRMEYLKGKSEVALDRLKGGDRDRALILNSKLESITNKILGDLKPSGSGKKVITPDIATVYLKKAGGDINKAKRLAAKDGYEVNVPKTKIPNLDLQSSDVTQSPTFPAQLMGTVHGRYPITEQGGPVSLMGPVNARMPKW